MYRHTRLLCVSKARAWQVELWLQGGMQQLWRGQQKQGRGCAEADVQVLGQHGLSSRKCHLTGCVRHHSTCTKAFLLQPPSRNDNARAPHIPLLPPPSIRFKR